MISLAHMTEWSKHLPWQILEQAEQDQVIYRLLLEIHSNNWSSSSILFWSDTTGLLRPGVPLNALEVFKLIIAK